MPLYAWIRGLALTLAGLLPLLGGLAAGLHGHGTVRVLGFAVAAMVLVVAGYLCWLYLPDVDWPGRTPRRGRAGRRRIALTFDDGPNAAATERVLDVLRRHGARATFFCVGEAVERTPELVRRMVADGHVVGNHTFEHRQLPWCSSREVRRQLQRTQEALIAAGAPRPTLFRAPHGFKSPFLGRTLTALGLRAVSWSHGVWDTDRPGVDVIVRRALRFLGDGEILLLHDGLPGCDRTQTAEALELILTECTRRGLAPVTLPELLEPA